jgi:hypothetical protein
MELDRFEYFCPDCNNKGVVTDVFVNSQLLILRGACPTCGVKSNYKVVERAELKLSHGGLAPSYDTAHLVVFIAFMRT